MIAKPQISAADAADLVTSGDRLMVGGFGMTGKPVALIDALAEKLDRQVIKQKEKRRGH